MMNAQQTTTPARITGATLQTLADGQVMPLGKSGGCLEVLDGRVWLTRSGELDDLFVERGQSVCIDASGDALIEAVDRGQGALIAWQPRTWSQRLRDGVRRLS